MFTKATFAVAIATLIACAISANIKCHVPPSYVQTLRYELNEKELLVNTFYDGVNVITDRTDRLVSAVVAKTGTWDP